MLHQARHILWRHHEGAPDCLHTNERTWSFYIPWTHTGGITWRLEATKRRRPECRRLDQWISRSNLNTIALHSGCTIKQKSGNIEICWKLNHNWLLWDFRFFGAFCSKNFTILGIFRNILLSWDNLERMWNPWRSQENSLEVAAFTGTLHVSRFISNFHIFVISGIPFSSPKSTLPPLTFEIPLHKVSVSASIKTPRFSNLFKFKTQKRRKSRKKVAILRLRAIFIVIGCNKRGAPSIRERREKRRKEPTSRSGPERRTRGKKRKKGGKKENDKRKKSP